MACEFPRYARRILIHAVKTEPRFTGGFSNGLLPVLPVSVRNALSLSEVLITKDVMVNVKNISLDKKLSRKIIHGSKL